MDKKIDNYSFSLKVILGKGTSGVVYKGQNDITNEKVAVKCVNNRSLNNDYAIGMIQS
jgi:serine/threonine-protein kinase ULK/ATG1